MSNSHRNSGPGQLTRSIVVSVDDSGPQQLVKMTGLADQKLDETVRSQHFGFSSNPPPDSEGLTLQLGGGTDRVHALGLEHPKYRPTDLPSGGSIQYDKDGNHAKIIGDLLEVKHAKKITLQCGSSSIVITPNSITLTSASIKMNNH